MDSPKDELHVPAAMTTVPHSMSPVAVRTPVTRELSRNNPVTGRSCNSVPRFSAACAKARVKR